jgi:hypothetical protein
MFRYYAANATERSISGSRECATYGKMQIFNQNRKVSLQNPPKLAYNLKQVLYSTVENMNDPISELFIGADGKWQRNYPGIPDGSITNAVIDESLKNLQAAGMQNSGLAFRQQSAMGDLLRNVNGQKAAIARVLVAAIGDSPSAEVVVGDTEFHLDQQGNITGEHLLAPDHSIFQPDHSKFQRSF